MKAIFLNDSHTESLSQVSLTSRDGFNEAWLQKTLYENPDLLNPLEIQDLDPIIPIARELTLQGSSSKVFLDIFGVRTSGTPVLIECKLWRNPQARRVVAFFLILFILGVPIAAIYELLKDWLKEKHPNVYGYFVSLSKRFNQLGDTTQSLILGFLANSAFIFFAWFFGFL